MLYEVITVMATIGILGTGRMGVRLAEAFAKAGTQVILGSRDPRRAERIVRGLKVSGLASGTYEEAVQAEFVLPAMFLRDGLIATLRITSYNVCYTKLLRM